MKTQVRKVGVIIMTYGSPKTLDLIPQFLKNVYGGKDASAEVIAEFRRRYSLIGGSPLVKITQDQAAALAKELPRLYPNGPKFKVIAGMRFSDPFINNVIPKLAQGADTVVGIIMSPQYSPIIMRGYTKDLKQAVAKLNKTDLKLKIAANWHTQPYFIKALAQSVKQALNNFPQEVKKSVPVLFSAHSMPKRVIDIEPDYINRLKQTAADVAKEVGLPKKSWRFCYQSAGHTPEAWLKPDFADLMPQLHAQGYKNVLIAPIQFLADHLEILYDIEIGARLQAEKYGIRFTRTASLNASPLFIKALASVVKETLSSTSHQATPLPGEQSK